MDTPKADRLVPVLSLVVALAGIAASVAIQYLSTQTQRELKELELTLEDKRTSYIGISRSLNRLLFLCANRERFQAKSDYSEVSFMEKLVDAANEFDTSISGLEPFLDIGTRQQLRRRASSVIATAFALLQSTGEARQKELKSLQVSAIQLREYLFPLLFSERAGAQLR